MVWIGSETTTPCTPPYRRFGGGNQKGGGDAGGVDEGAISIQPDASEPNLGRTTKIRVLVADDDEAIRDAFVQILNQDERFMVVAVASDGREAIQKSIDTKPDVAVLDWFMPRLNGYDAARIMAAADDGPRTMVTTGYPQDTFAIQALQSGVLGFLPKTLGIIELADAVQKVAEGRIYVSPEVARKVAEVLGSAPVMSAVNGPLTVREREILQLIAEGNSNSEIAETLRLSPRTIGNHRVRIMRKLGIHEVAGLTRYAIRVGLLRP